MSYFKAKTEDKSLFLANISHELRTPLNSIMGLVGILLREEDIPREHKQSLEIVKKSSDYLLEIVNNILDISKIEAGKVVLENRPFNITSLIYALVDQMKPLAAEKGLTFVSNEDDLLLTNVIGDQLQLKRVILNLLGNAVKYTLEGEVKVDFSLTEKRGETIMFDCCICDTGIGIEREKLDIIFDKFTQAEESTERRFGGTGLGLNITKQLIQLMNGIIDVNSTLGKGSCFRISIPFEKAPIDCKVEATHDAYIIGNYENFSKKRIEKARVLVAEDHDFNQVFALKLLEKFGVQDIETANNGQIAVEKSAWQHFDLILMDGHMPTMNGYEAARTIRAQEEKEDHEQPAIIVGMTADVTPETREMCLSAGMDEYIAKPVDEMKFFNLMQSWFIFPDHVSKAVFGGFVKSLNHGRAPANLKTIETYADGDPAIQKELITLFCTKSESDIQTLRASQDPKAHDVWVEAAHGLKGSALYIGAMYLFELCDQAQNIEKDSLEERQALFSKIENEHIYVCSYLKKSEIARV